MKKNHENHLAQCLAFHTGNTQEMFIIILTFLYNRERSAKFFCKGQIVNILDYLSHTVSVTTKIGSKLHLAHGPQFANPCCTGGFFNLSITDIWGWVTVYCRELL